jgi:5-methyltetrahydrofolate--homocysteine methyltransferase
MSILEEIFESVLIGEIDEVGKLTKNALEQKLPVSEIINKGYNNALKEVGIRFEKQEYFLPEMLASAMAVKKGMEALGPLLRKESVKTLGTIVIGTVEGDIHDVGKNIVIMMLEGAGFKVYDLGVDVSMDKFVKAVKEYNPDILAMSALLNITMQYMGEVIHCIIKEGIRKKIKIVVGGSPLSQEFSDSIGADGYAADATKAVKKIQEILNL